MNRTERRRLQREGNTTEKLKKWLHGLTPEQRKLFSLTVGQKVDEINKDTEYVLDSCYAAAIDDNLDINLNDLKKIVIEANGYMEEVKEYLNKNREGYFKMIENEKMMNEVKEDIIKFMNEGKVKSKALLEIKKKYNIPGNVASDLWLQVKEEEGINTTNPHTPNKDTEKEKFLNKIGQEQQEILNKEIVVDKEDKIVVGVDFGKEDSTSTIIQHSNKLKIKSIEIEGQFGTYFKGTEGVKIGDKIYKDITEVEEAKKARESDIKERREDFQKRLDAIHELIKNLDKVEKEEFEVFAEIEEVFKML